MRETIKKSRIINVGGDYPLNVQVLVSKDGGNTFWYCGIGKFCKNQEEVNKYINSIE